MKKYLLATVAASLSVGCFTHTAMADEFSFDRWKVYSANGQSVKPAAMIERLRTRGPEALTELLAVREHLSGRLGEERSNAALEILTQELAELDQLIDAVGGQRYCSRSKLFWYTDLDRAREVSRESGKPILSLRLLGNLTDELSCANSRFFRTTLYANSNISEYLRNHFVLHWKSVRPAPVMTIDFGDGRRIIRTVTGNSIHYVLDSEGRPLDALPGLYGPQAFQEWLQRANDLGVAVEKSATADQRSLILTSYHENRQVEIQREWQQDLQKLGLVSTQTFFPGAQTPGSNQVSTIPAEKAAAIALPKGRMEAKPIAMITMNRSEMDGLTTDSVWRDIAMLHAEEAELDEASRSLIYAEIPLALRSDLLAITKSGAERGTLTKLLASLRSSTALDTVRNEYELHLEIHEWFLSGEAGTDVDSLNNRVYAELFLTPESDPWLGLFDPTAYTGLTDAGIVDMAE